MIISLVLLLPDQRAIATLNYTPSQPFRHAIV